MLAALDNNMNTGRKQKTTVIKNKTGIGLKIKHHFRIAYRKPNKKIIARKFYDHKEYNYLKVMMETAREYAAAGKGNREATKRKVMAPTERVPRSETIENSVKYSRFK